MFIMFPLFNRHAAANATYIETPVMPGAPMPPAKAVPPLENDATATEQPVTYDELLPSLMLAMAAAL
jgi:hypothetical protein